ncbi:hypothetical protein [Arcticibacter sp. MXS-1]
MLELFIAIFMAVGSPMFQASTTAANDNTEQMMPDTGGELGQLPPLP